MQGRSRGPALISTTEISQAARQLAHRPSVISTGAFSQAARQLARRPSAVTLVSTAVVFELPAVATIQRALH